jgi:hypothetical protein
MLCIFCSEKQPPSLEHVFPLAIGGTITTDRVCHACNSTLGSRVNAALSDFLPVRTRRAMLGLAGNARAAPSQFEIFLGDAKLIGPAANRIRTTLNKATGKLDIRQFYHATDVVLPDGRKDRQITIDARDRDQIPTIIRRERKRHGVPPLSEEVLAAAAEKFPVTAVKNPLVQVTLSVSFAYGPRPANGPLPDCPDGPMMTWPRVAGRRQHREKEQARRRGGGFRLGWRTLTADRRNAKSPCRASPAFPA